MERTERIPLTKAQKRWAEWMCGPMPDYFESLVSDGELTSVPPLPHVEGNELVVPDMDNGDVYEDMRYRLVEQAADIVEGADTEQQAAAHFRSASELWRKIRQSA